MRDHAGPALVAVLAAVTAAGCLGGPASSPPTGPRPVAPHDRSAGVIVQGRAFTTDCGGPAGGSSCARTPYEGRLVFCRTLRQIGPCPSVRVGAAGRFRIRLHAGGRWALIPAPGKGNIVLVSPRWVSVGPGGTVNLDINGDNLTRCPIPGTAPLRNGPTGVSACTGGNIGA